ncbi:MAG: DUF6959 family protein [Pirellulales bacterium]
MKETENGACEILSNAINQVVVKTPGRHFPGMVIQGDSLAKLYRCASEVCRLANDSGDEELIGEANALCQELGDRLSFYEDVLRSRGIDIPYASPLVDQVVKP